jgi:hypothetical protein
VRHTKGEVNTINSTGGNKREASSPKRFMTNTTQ